MAIPFARGILLCTAIFAALAFMQGCVGGGTGSAASPPPPPPPSIAVSVTPAAISVLLGNSHPFTANVSNASDTRVTWSVNGIPGGNTATGTISADGLYTAPVDLPSLNKIQIAATSVADPAKSGSAEVTVLSDIAIALLPNPASIELGAAQKFQAAISSAGHPDAAIRWGLASPCSPTCGTLDANGSYIAPQILPSPATATIAAQSVADPSRRASVTVAIISNFSLQLTAPPSVPVSGTAIIAATFTAVPGSNPSTALSWAVSGAGCSGATCGVLSVVTTQSAGSNPSTSSATYTAPATAPSPNTVTVTVTPLADPSKKAQAIIAVQPGVGITLSPTTATLAANHRVTLTAQLFGISNSSVTWSVNGVPSGSNAAGQICATAATPCQPFTSTTNLQVDYLAPGAMPSPNPVSVQATSDADPTKSASAQITVINHVLVTVSPTSVTLAPLATQPFTATVLGSTNQRVTWQVQGTACGTPGACGVIDATGLYTAPSSMPSPNTLQVVAISADDTSQSAAANVTISGGPQILALRPASVYAGSANGFTLRVDGSNFAPTTPGSGSVLSIAGTARTTTCSTANQCTAPVTPTDVAAAGSVSVQLRNPDGSASNGVSLIVVAPNNSDEVISLSASAPMAIGKDIVVVEPTTAGVSVPGSNVDLNVAALGRFDTVNNSCTLAGNGVPLTRPTGGSGVADICLFSQSGLDTSMSYVVTGPGDVSVIAKQPAGLGIIHLTLQIAATAALGARTLFIQNTNLDKTAATGALEVQ